MITTTTAYGPACTGPGNASRYAATKDPVAKERAKKAFEALKFLGDVTQGGDPPVRKGFIARSIRPADGPDPNESPSYSADADENRRDNYDRLWKVIHPRWPKSADGKWYWKCDTSSDELDGHSFSMRSTTTWWRIRRKKAARRGDGHAHDGPSHRKRLLSH